MSKQTWATHANPKAGTGRRLPDAETMHGIAEGLGVDVGVVGMAALETMGILAPDRDRPALLDLLPPWDVLARLTPAQITTVVQLIYLLAQEGATPPAPRAHRPVAVAAAPAQFSHPGLVSARA